MRNQREQAAPQSAHGGAVAQWSQRAIPWQDDERSYLVYEPRRFAREGTSVVIFAHGYGDNARSLARSLPIETWAGEYGFAAIVPFADQNPESADGGRTSWNAGACCAFGDPTRDDLGFIRSLIARVRSTYPTKDLDFYLIGFSNGGFLAETVACRHPDWFRGVSSIGGSLSVNQPPCERPTNSLRVHRVTGAADQRIMRAGGQTPLGRYASFDDDFDTWETSLACSATVTDADGPSSCRTSTCTAGSVRFCLVEELGHQWPTDRTFSFDAFDDAWEFWTK